MRWFCDRQSPLGHRLRLVLVLLVLGAVALPTSLLGTGPRPAALRQGGPNSAAGLVPPLHGEDGALVAAAMRKRNTRAKQKQDEQKADTKGKKDKKQADRKGKKQGKQNGNKQNGNKQGRNGSNKQDKAKTKQGKDSVNPQGDGARANAVAAAAAPLTLIPVADAQVNEANPNYNYGARTQLLVDGGADPDVAGYLRFDVSGVSGTVQQATLRLWVQATGGTQNGPEVRTTSSSWNETSLTWNNRPAPSGGILDDKGNLPGSTWAEYNVTSVVRGNGAVGFVLLPQSNDGAVFDSREGANKPQLVITLASGVPTPTPTPGPNPTPTPTPTPPPTSSVKLLAAGDISSCSSSGDEATATLLDGLSGTVATLGDNAYESGTASEFTNCYGPTWGRHKSKTRPSTGNHEYQTSGASGYFGYFGSAAGDSTKGYYSYTLGSWHIVVLNSNCSQAGGCAAGSPQEKWLRQDLAANPTTCTLAYWHHPRFSFGNYGNDTRMQAMWQALQDHGAEVVLSGHDHNYQRYAPQTPSGARDTARGIREFVVGTGGKGLYGLKTPPANVEQYNDTTHGILQLTLRSTGYDWKFIPVAGKTFTDTGSTNCH